MAYGRSDFDPTCQPYNTGFYDYYGRRGPNYTNEAAGKLFQRAADTAGCYQYGTDMTPIHYRQPGTHVVPLRCESHLANTDKWDWSN